jgi:hypothetical protein
MSESTDACSDTMLARAAQRCHRSRRMVTRSGFPVGTVCVCAVGARRPMCVCVCVLVVVQGELCKWLEETDACVCL